MKNLTFIIAILLTSNVLNVALGKLKLENHKEAEDKLAEIKTNLEKLRECHQGQIKDLNDQFGESEHKLVILHRQSEHTLSDTHRLEETVKSESSEDIESHFREESVFRESHAEKEHELTEEHREKIEVLAEELHHDEEEKLDSSLVKLQDEYMVNQGLHDKIEEAKEEFRHEIETENEGVECYYNTLEEHKKDELNELIHEEEKKEEELIHGTHTENSSSISESSSSSSSVDSSSHSSSSDSDSHTQITLNNIHEEDDSDDDYIFHSSHIDEADFHDCPTHVENLLIDDISHDEECLHKAFKEIETDLGEIHAHREMGEKNAHRHFESSTGADFNTIDRHHKQEDRHRQSNSVVEQKQFEYDQKLENFVSQEHYKLYERMKDINKADSRLKNSLIDEVEYDLEKDEQDFHDSLVDIEIEVEEAHQAEENADVQEHQQLDNSADENVVEQHHVDERALKDSHVKEEEELVEDHEKIMHFLEDEHQRDVEVLEHLRSSE
jgi:hypothetical protein